MTDRAQSLCFPLLSPKGEANYMIRLTSITGNGLKSWYSLLYLPI